MELTADLSQNLHLPWSNLEPVHRCAFSVGVLQVSAGVSAGAWYSTGTVQEAEKVIKQTLYLAMSPAALIQQNSIWLEKVVWHVCGAWR